MTNNKLLIIISCFYSFSFSLEMYPDSLFVNNPLAWSDIPLLIIGNTQSDSAYLVEAYSDSLEIWFFYGSDKDCRNGFAVNRINQNEMSNPFDTIAIPPNDSICFYYVAATNFPVCDMSTCLACDYVTPAVDENATFITDNSDTLKLQIAGIGYFEIHPESAIIREKEYYKLSISKITHTDCRGRLLGAKSKANAFSVIIEKWTESKARTITWH